MYVKQDCKECVWYQQGKRPRCKVGSGYLNADPEGNIIPPNDCWRSPNYKRNLKGGNQDE